jgi:hypothetical protein
MKSELGWLNTIVRNGVRSREGGAGEGSQVGEGGGGTRVGRDAIKEGGHFCLDY